MGGQQVRKGQVFHYRLLVGRGVIGGEKSDREWTEFTDKMGIHGPPAYGLDVTQGKVLSTQYVVEAEAANGGFRATIGQADLPVRLPIRIRGVSPRSTAGIVDLADLAWMPVGVIETESAAYATWDTSRGPADLYIGNLVLTDSPELTITTLREGDAWRVWVHNPTDKSITASIVGAKAVAGLSELNRAVTVPAGQTAALTVELARDATSTAGADRHQQME